jgi:hypothetical protein
MHETTAYASKYFQSLLAMSVCHSYQAPKSFVDGVHWFNRVVSCFIGFGYSYSFLYTSPPAHSNRDGMYRD